MTIKLYLNAFNVKEDFEIPVTNVDINTITRAMLFFEKWS